MAPRARVFTIPASVPFLPRLVREFLDGTLVPGFTPGRDPLALAAATLYLPTRRACRLARDLFLDALARRHAGPEGPDSSSAPRVPVQAALLPQILAIGDVDEDELAFADAAAGSDPETSLDLAPAFGGLERKILLARLVLGWASAPGLHASLGAPLVAQGPAAALALAEDLTRLIDDMTMRQVSWDRLDDLVPERFDQYWQLSLEFLKIARRAWPQILAERGAIEAAARRDQLIAAAAARIAEKPDAPVIAAGSTGSMPATAALLATIARLPHGAIVLPGLDTDLDPASWNLIAGSGDKTSDRTAPVAGHPQFAMQALLARLGVARDTVTELAPPAAHGREHLLSEALRPADATELWKDRLAAPAVERALDGVSVVEATNAEEEAMAVAVALREAAEEPGKTAALVTPDRALARRVIAALGRWAVAVDDSGGDPLSDTPAGIFARLTAEAGLQGLAPVTLLAVLKHRLFRLGAGAGAHDRAVAALERALLRGPRPRAGTGGLAHALATLRQEQLHLRDPRANLGRPDLDAADRLIRRLQAALAPLENLRRPHRFGEIVALHRDVVAALGGDGTGAVAAFAGEDGAELELALAENADRPADDDLTVTQAEYCEVFSAVIADRVVRRPLVPGARIRVLGPLEARLQTFDRVVLGGLVEGTWPPEPRTDPWLSRPMRHELGLDLPERRIGLSAHDFAQLLGAPEVVLVRAAKLAGVPTVASRFVQRLGAVAGKPRWDLALRRGERTLMLARGLDQPSQTRRIRAPAPRPPRNARPSRLSVTDVENWLRDPYTIYAKHVLALTPLDAVDTPPGARDRGTVIHAAIAEFTANFADVAADDPMGELLRLGREHFAALDDYPEARAFWWPRYRRIASWFARWDVLRRRRIDQTHAEIRGEIEIALGERSFRLAARADRIDRMTGGGYTIVDYKTGEARSEKQVRSGLAPQLTLEAAILRRGGFAEIPARASVAGLVYVTLRGGNPAGREELIDFAEGTPDSQADTALARFTAMAVRFEDPAEPYRSLVHPMWRQRYGDYDHLARVKEWSATGGESDEAGE